MLKKTLLTVAVVSLLLAVTAQAGEIKEDCWPGKIVFDWAKIEGLVIPVKMDIEMFIEIMDQKRLKKGFKLQQDNLHDWSGSIGFDVKSNFAYKIRPTFELSDDGKDMWNQQSKSSKKVEVDPGTGDATFCNTTNHHELKVQLKGLDIVHLPPKKTVVVGTCGLEVAPQDIPGCWDP